MESGSETITINRISVVHAHRKHNETTENRRLPSNGAVSISNPLSMSMFAVLRPSQPGLSWPVDAGGSSRAGGTGRQSARAGPIAGSGSRCLPPKQRGLSDNHIGVTELHAKRTIRGRLPPLEHCPIMTISQA